MPLQLCRHALRSALPRSRSLATTTTTTTTSPQLSPSPSPVHPLLPPSNQIQSALSTLSSLPELHQALQTPSPLESQTLLTRLLQITHSLSGSHAAIIHSLLAKLYHSLGNLSTERLARLNIISTLSKTPPDPQDLQLHNAHIAAAHLSLSLSCLRAPDAEYTLAASAAATSAQHLASHPVLRTSATLATAISDGPNARATRTMLSALVAVQKEPYQSAPDIPGFARAFLAMWDTHIESRLDHAKALVVRWEAHPGFDFVEALCLAGNTLLQTGIDSDQDMAEDMFSRAVRVAGEIGGELDKGEALLGLARLYQNTGRLIEAEGMFRSIEERFQPVWNKKRFTVPSADLYCRAMEHYADFLHRSQVKRDKEAELRRSNARQVRELFPEVLSERSAVPLWVVDSLLPAFELPAPVLTETK